MFCAPVLLYLSCLRPSLYGEVWEVRIEALTPHVAESSLVPPALSPLSSCRGAGLGCTWGGLVQQPLTWLTSRVSLLQAIPPTTRGAQLWSCPSSSYKPCLVQAWVHAKSLQLCPTLCDPMDCSLPGSSVHGILQARILEWVATPSSRESFWPRDWTSHLLWFLHWQVDSLPIAPPWKPLLGPCWPPN